MVLLALFSVRPLREARRPTEEAPSNFLYELSDLFKSYAFRIFILFNLVDGFEALLDLGFLIYYLSYVSKLTGSERTLYLGAAPALGYAVAVVAGFVWVHLFSEKKLNPTKYAQAGLLLNVAIRPIFIFSSDANSGQQ